MELNENAGLVLHAYWGKQVIEEYAEVSGQEIGKPAVMMALIVRDLLNYCLVSNENPEVAISMIQNAIVMQLQDLMQFRISGGDDPAVSFDALLATMKSPKLPAGFEKFMPGGQLIMSEEMANLRRLALRNEMRAEVAETEVELLSVEVESLKTKLSDARAKLFPYADDKEICGVSWDGKYLIGNKESIGFVHTLIAASPSSERKGRAE